MLTKFCRDLKVILVLSTVSVLLTGCWSSRELSELGITFGMGIDKAGDFYKVSLQVVEPSQVASSSQGQGGDRVPVTLYVMEGKSVSEVLHKVTTVMSRRIYLGHLRMLIVGEKLARDDIASVMGYFGRERELRTDFYIAIARNAEASDVLSMLTSLEKIPTVEMFFSLETSEQFWSATQGVFLDKLINQLTNEGEALALTGIEIIGDPAKGMKEEMLKRTIPETLFQFTGFGIFHHGQLKSWLSADESKGYNYITGNVRKSSLSMQYDCGHVDIEVKNARESIKGKVVDGIPHIYLMLRVEGNINSVTCAIDLSNPEVIKEIELAAEKNMIQLLQRTVAKQKKIKLDFLTFGATLHRQDPKGWKMLKKRDYAYLDDLVVDYKVDYKIRRIGARIKTYNGEIKE